MLRADRMDLLEKFTPIDAADFHAQLENALSRRMDLLERLKLDPSKLPASMGLA